MKASVRPDSSGPGIYRFLLGEAFLACAADRHDDRRYAASVKRLYNMAQPIITRHAEKWKELKDGKDGKDGHPGFWINAAGQPLQPGDLIPKEAFASMEGAVMEIVYAAGVFWSKEVGGDVSTDFFQAAMERSALGKALELNGDASPAQEGPDATS